MLLRRRYVPRLTSVRPRRKRRVWPASAGHRFTSLGQKASASLQPFFNGGVVLAAQGLDRWATGFSVEFVFWGSGFTRVRERRALGGDRVRAPARRPARSAARAGPAAR
jgi:hypothetical protein